MITEAQRKARKNHIGSSDTACLFNDADGNSLDPFKTALDLWCEKHFDVEPLDGTEAMARGNRYEAALIDFARDELGCWIETDPKKMNFVCKDHPIFACNLDGKTVHKLFYDSSIIEAKTTSMAAEYGEPGTDGVPLRVNLQCQQQMLCTGFDKAYVVALLGGFRLHEEIFVIERSEKIIAAIITAGEDFWNNHVLTGIPPAHTEPGNIEVFKRIIRQPETFAEVPPHAFIEWEESKRQANLYKKLAETNLANILKHLGDAEGAHMDDGRTFTYFSQKGADKLDLKTLEQTYPEVYAAIATPSRHRVARIKKA